MAGTKVVVGIGNPGKKYAGTRHNIGFRVLEVLARKEEWSFRKDGFAYESAGGRVRSRIVVLVRPLTYVNRTGEILPDLGHRYEPSPEDLLVVCDDIALPLGSIRVRAKGSSGGHNGLKSIIDALGSEAFARMRLGVGAPAGIDAADYVLDRFRKDEETKVAEVAAEAAAAARCWILEGVERCMNKFNRRVSEENA